MSQLEGHRQARRRCVAGATRQRIWPFTAELIQLDQRSVRGKRQRLRPWRWHRSRWIYISSRVQRGKADVAMASSAVSDPSEVRTYDLHAMKRDCHPVVYSP